MLFENADRTIKHKADTSTPFILAKHPRSFLHCFNVNVGILQKGELLG